MATTINGADDDTIIVIEKAGTTCEWGYGILCDAVGPRLVALDADDKCVDTGVTDQEVGRLIELPAYWVAWTEAKGAK